MVAVDQEHLAPDIEIGLRVPPCRNLRDLRAFAVRAERQGIQALWYPDSQLLWRDTFAALSVAALDTERIMLGTAVTNVETRHLSVLASAARTVQEVAGGRFRLGVGAGSSATGNVGLAHSTGRRLEEAVHQLRALLAGELVDFGAGGIRLNGPSGGCPIYLAASGSRNLARAGRVGDGVILPPGLAQVVLQHQLSGVAAGTADAGRRIEDVDVVVGAFCRITDDVEGDARLMKPLLAAGAAGDTTGLLAATGIALEARPRLPATEPDLPHAYDWDAAVEACSWITDAQVRQFVDTWCLFGTPESIRSRISDAAEQFGVRRFLLHAVSSYELPVDLLDGLT